MTDPLVQEFVAEVEEFRARHHMSKSGFSNRAKNSPNWYARVKRGDISPTTGSLKDVRAWMAAWEAGDGNQK